jgi:hypothetical protein
MCLILYASTPKRLPEVEAPEISVRLPDPDRASNVRRWMSFPHVYEIGSSRGCGCGFPSVIPNAADASLEWDWRSEEPPDPVAVSELEALAGLIRTHLAPERFELWPTEYATENEPPDGRIDLTVSAFEPASFYFNEGFLYRVAGV